MAEEFAPLSNPLFRKISHIVDSMGVEAYVVGGYVRDYYLRRPSTDIDVVVVGSGIEVAEALGREVRAKVSVFKTFGTAMVRAYGAEVEFVGARKESYTQDSRKPMVAPGTLEDDQRRRDFTINAMAWSLNGERFGELVDPFEGMYDLEDGDENKLKLSPDVSFEHIFSDSYVFYGKAGGGRKTNSFYQLTSQYSPYWMSRELIHTYVTLDAALGVKGSPANGWWFNLSGGYKITENDFIPFSLLMDYVAYFANVSHCKTKVFYGTGELKYDYKDFWSVYFKGTYYSWDGEGPYVSWSPGAEKHDVRGLLPEFEINAGVGVKMLEGLKLNLGYEFVKRRDGERYDPISNLYAGIDYALLKNLSVFGQVNNLKYIDIHRCNCLPNILRLSRWIVVKGCDQCLVLYSWPY